MSELSVISYLVFCVLDFSSDFAKRKDNFLPIIQKLESGSVFVSEFSLSYLRTSKIMIPGVKYRMFFSLSLVPPYKF